MRRRGGEKERTHEVYVKRERYEMEAEKNQNKKTKKRRKNQNGGRTGFSFAFRKSKALFLNDMYAIVTLLTEILSVEDTGSFAGLRNSLEITRYNTTTVFAWIVL